MFGFIFVVIDYWDCCWLLVEVGVVVVGEVLLVCSLGLVYGGQVGFDLGEIYGGVQVVWMNEGVVFGFCQWCVFCVQVK